ncbi:MAG: hypothetical protein F4089_14460 [Gammaproteobacteria bacterium]|nr:hypothetical protein [Gammaproteobacteria bacterium]MYJ76211.1 hypothetical protein [Gammaproteobacteria bacterium]
MVADTANIRTRLEELHDLPTPVRSWLVEEGVDATDDPAVWVWAMIEQDDADPETLDRLKVIAREVVHHATGLWAYVLIRGADEAEATA